MLTGFPYNALKEEVCVSLGLHGGTLAQKQQESYWPILFTILYVLL